MQPIFISLKLIKEGDMKNLKSNILTIILLTLLAGCSNPTIDCSSDENMKKSIQNVREKLPEAKRAEFDDAMKILAFSQINLGNLLIEGATGVGNIEGKVQQLLNGKTGDQVIAEAERIRTERKERERNQALKEIQELEVKLVKSESDRAQLKEFKVLRSRFYMQERAYIGKQPIVELTVQNGTPEPVSRAYFEGTLASPNRSVPWYKDTFNYSISGGIEPGEEASWTLAPNMFSGWGKIDAPPDAMFTVTVERLDGPDGEPIYSKEFNEYDQKRLDELKKEYGVN